MTRLESILTALRARLLTVTTLPDARAWQNTALTPDPSAPFVADYMLTMDTQNIELGPTPRARTTLLYQVSVRVPVNTGAHPALAIASAIADAFRTGGLVYVNAEPMTLLDERIGPLLQDASWFHVPISFSLHFDHT